jgi:hypothetical protein
MPVARALMKLGPRTAAFPAKALGAFRLRTVTFLAKAPVAFRPWTAALLRLLCPDVSKTAAYIAAPASSCANRRRLASFPLQRIACAAWRVAPLLDGALSFICLTAQLFTLPSPTSRGSPARRRRAMLTRKPPPATPPYARHARLATL